MKTYNELLFAEFDNLLSIYGVNKAQDIFRLLNEYQNYRLDNIEKANNENNRIALQRTLDYQAIDLSYSYKKAKTEKAKDKILFKIVNNFVLQIPELRYKNWSDWTSESYNICVSYKDAILKNKEWYLQIIPESKWLIEHLENLNKVKEGSIDETK